MVTAKINLQVFEAQVLVGFAMLSGHEHSQITSFTSRMHKAVCELPSGERDYMAAGLEQMNA